MSGWEDEWKILRENFAALTRTRFETMEALMRGLEGPGASPQGLEELTRHFHSLKGVGASYGFPGITALGKHSQEECRAMLDKGGLPGPEDLQRFRQRLDDMKKELASGGLEGKPE